MVIPDNYSQWERHEAEQEALLEKFPVCEICGEPIQDEHLYLINDEFVCQECLEREFQKQTEDYIA